MAVTNPADSSFWDDLSQLTGKATQGAASGRAAQGQYLNQRDALAARLYDIAQTARTQAANQNLNTDKYRNSLAGVGANEAVRGALIENAQPATLDPGTSHMTRMSFSGGTTPASFTPETRAAGAALAKHGTSLLDNPSGALTSTPGSGVGGQSFLQAPALSPEPTAGFWENAGGATSIASGILGALARAGGGSGGGGDLSKAASALKKLFGGGDGTTMDTNPLVYGNPDFPLSQPLPPGLSGQSGVTEGASATGETSGQAIDPTTGQPLPYGDDSSSWIPTDWSPSNSGGQ
jgi:hypothetical protein